MRVRTIGGSGLARDLPVRWALEEVGQPWDIRLRSFAAMKQPPNRRWHRFSQSPSFEQGDLALFESGAIVFHVADRHAGLLPRESNARARAISWMFARLSTVEPPILECKPARLIVQGTPWYAERLPTLESRIRLRLNDRASQLGKADGLDGDFSNGDRMMVTVLRRLRGSDLLTEFANLAAYVARAEARPAFKRAFADQLAVFTGSAAQDPPHSSPG